MEESVGSKSQWDIRVLPQPWCRDKRKSGIVGVSSHPCTPAGRPVHSIIRARKPAWDAISTDLKLLFTNVGHLLRPKMFFLKYILPHPLLVFKPMWILREIESICFWFICTELIKM